MRRSRTQMGPGASGHPYVRSVAFRRGWLVVGIRRELAQFPQRVHLVALHESDAPQTVHEGIELDTDEKTRTVRFEPTTDDELRFDPVVPLSDSPPEEHEDVSSSVPDEALPMRVAFRVVYAERPSREFDAVTATLEEQAGSLSVTDLEDDVQLEPGRSR